MSEKQAKKLRKMERNLAQLRKEFQDKNPRKEVPVAGCSNCDGAGWYIELDAFPPLARTIVSFVCMGCEARVVTDIDMQEMRGRRPIDYSPQFEGLKERIHYLESTETQPWP